FASGCGCQLMTKSERECGENKTYVNVSDVIANHQRGAVETAQILSALNAWPTKQEHSWAQQEIVNDETNPRDRSALHACRIVIDSARRWFALEHALQLADGPYGREAGLA